MKKKKVYVIRTEVLWENEFSRMLKGTATYYHRGTMIPWNKDSAPILDFCYETKEKAERALKYALKHKVFEQWPEFKDIADTFKVVEIEC